MARPRKLYHIFKNRPTSCKWSITLNDHLAIKRTLPGHPDKSTTEHVAKNIAAIVNFKSAGQPLSPELRTFIESQPKEIRDKLVLWGIMDTDTNAGFEALAVYTKVKAPNSKLMRYDVTGGHVFDWQEYMKATGYTVHHIRESIACVMRVIGGCQFTTPLDINEEDIRLWLSRIKEQGKSIGTVNGYLKSFKTFVRWLCQHKRISHNPVKYLTPYKVVDKQRPRRALLENETTVLLTATSKAEKHHGLTGHERKLAYLLGLEAGLRYNEIYTLNRNDIVCTGNELRVTVQAGNAKNRKCQSVPLREELAKDLQDYLNSNLAMPNTRLFSGMWKDAGADTLKDDLKLAGIEYETDDGVLDFHALRHTFGTMLARHGVPPQIAQKLMRHANYNTTLKYYTHLTHGDLSKALKQLPTYESGRQVKTGTCDMPEDYTLNNTLNSTKIYKNPVKSSNMGVYNEAGTGNVKPCKSSDLQGLN